MSVVSGAPALGVPRLRAAERVRVGTRDGEGVALGLTTIAVVGLPLLAPHGPSGTAPEDVLIFLAVAAALLWASRSGHRLRFAYGLPFALFMVGGVLGALVGPVPVIGAVSIVQDAMLLVWTWVFINIAADPRRLRVLLSAWVYGSICWGVLLFVGLVTHTAFLTGQIAKEGSRTALTFGDPNVSANFYVISIMLMCATGLPRRRLSRVAAYLLLVAAIFSTGSNSGVVSLVVAVSLTTLLGIRRRSGTTAALGAAAVLAGVGLLLVSTVSFKSVQQRAYKSHYAFIRDGLGRGEVSVGQRDTLLHEGLRLYRTGGLLGQGPVSTKTRLTDEQAPFVKEAHNDYLASLTERGVIGAVGLILFMSALVTRTFWLGRTRLSPRFAAVVVRPNAIVGAVAGTMTTMAVYELLHVRHVWTLFALVAALYLWGRE